MVDQVIALIPQQPPFRFIDAILDVDERNISATYRFRADEYFYRGHFPDNPITPGVILIEAMAQTAVVAMGIHRLLGQGVSPAEIRRITCLFALAEAIEFNGIVRPGEQVRILGALEYLRKGNLKTRARIERPNGELVCSGILTGTGITPFGERVKTENRNWKHEAGMQCIDEGKGVQHA